MEYRITATVGTSYYSGTKNDQFVQMKGTLGGTEEVECEGVFSRGGEVTCTVKSQVNIGSFRCVSWRTAGHDGWNLDEVRLK